MNFVGLRETKKAGSLTVLGRDLSTAHSIDLPSSQGLVSASASPGYDFSSLPIAAPPVAISNSPLSLASPRACPFGGACHTCPAHVQAKLVISQPDDEYEREADKAAEEITRMPEPPHIGRTCERCAGDDNVQLRRKEAPEKTAGVDVQSEALSAVQEVLRSPGQPLDSTTRSFMEPRFGTDFSDVRVHSDAPAAESARATNARAYTVARDVVFAINQYSPNTSVGGLLLAHELAHFTQPKNNTFLLRKSGGNGNGAPFDWTENVRKARIAFKRHDTQEAEILYREAIVFAASSVIVPSGLMKITPEVEDIRLDFRLTYIAETRGKEVPANETNYWHWIYFGPDSLFVTPGNTESTIVHELVHVRQYQKLWEDFKKDTSTEKGTWESFYTRRSPKGRVEGPEELEAAATGLSYLERMEREEQELTLRSLLVAYVNTSAYTPASGEVIAMTTEAAGTEILNTFKSANANLQMQMGYALCWALIKVGPPKEIWRHALRQLKLLAVKAYSDKLLQPHYDKFLELEGLEFAEIIGEQTKLLPLRRSSAGQAAPDRVPLIVQEALYSPGQPLDPSTRSFMEPRFGCDLSKVRVHTDMRAAESARALHAMAYTARHDIVFGAGRYQPETAFGRTLMAHELVHTLQQSRLMEPSQAASTVRLQREQSGTADPGATDWKASVENAKKAAQGPKPWVRAERLYKALIVRAAEKTVLPDPLAEKKPTTADIRWSWKTDVEYAAITDSKLVDKAPDDHWRWMTFNPSAVQVEEAVTVGVIAHELDHAAHAKTLYQQWKTTSSGRGSWPGFWVAHSAKWTEPQIKLTQLGLLNTLAGLPKKITPSAIEFRAYTQQFVSFFHKSSTAQQGFLSKGVILFYPLIKQEVKAKIYDPAMDVAMARQNILDYFKTPPVKDEAQREIIRTLMAWEFYVARMHRYPDSASITAAFQPIFDRKVDAEERSEARAKYKPGEL